MSKFSQIKIIAPSGVFTIPWSERIQGQEFKLTGKFPPETLNIIFASFRDVKLSDVFVRKNGIKFFKIKA